ncbi:hypothetical protein [Parasphingorhabdus sp.]|uniref:hypothetical protein n=1 Tax=Parasphingorhabdus sp. TaxID=2709688 RepID=UPI0035937858
MNEKFPEKLTMMTQHSGEIQLKRGEAKADRQQLSIERTLVIPDGCTKACL